MRTKKLYVLAAMEVERFKAKALNPQALLAGPPTGASKTRAAATLDGLMTLDSAQSQGSSANMENAWHGAEVRTSE